MRSRIFYLLLLVIVLNFGYPLTLYLGPAGQLLFVSVYALMFVVGVLVTSEDRAHFLRTVHFSGVDVCAGLQHHRDAGAGQPARQRARPSGAVAASRLFQLCHVRHSLHCDIVPVNPWTRALASFEGMVGVLYVATLVGRIVGMYSQERVKR